MSSSYQNALVITGGASGIGAACVRDALNRGWLVAFCDIVPIALAPPDLLHDHAVYVQADVRDVPSMASFRNHALQSFRDHNVGVVPGRCTWSPPPASAAAGIRSRSSS